MQGIKILSVLYCLFLTGCHQSPEKMITGHWKVHRPEDAGNGRREIHLYLNADHSLRMEIMSSRREPDVHHGTYELKKEGKLLIVHREGKNDKTNEAEIAELSSSTLVLVDHKYSAAGDTTRLKKVD